MKNSSWRYAVALGISLLGLIAIVLFILKPPFLFQQLGLDPKTANDYGSYAGGFIGSLFSLAGVFLLFETLVRQQEIFERQQFETRFYELIGLHCSNVKDIPAQTNEPTHSENARGSFASLIADFTYGSFLFNAQHVPEIRDIPRQEQSSLEYGKNVGPKFTELELIDLYFNLTYVGYSEIYDSILQKHIEGFKADESKYKLIQDFIAEIRTRPLRFGYEENIGIYFRHLFHTLKYIDAQRYLTVAEKLDYITIVRSHLSTNELASLFLYSVSSVGNYSELSHENPGNLINKYSLFRNLPKGYILDIDHTQYYPETI